MNEENNVFNFTDYKKKKNSRRTSGRLVWLYCPKCDLFRYTHILSEIGRTHNCGTEVIEKEFLLDLSAEYAISVHNSKSLENLRKKLGKKKREALLRAEEIEKEYQSRLESAGGKKLKTPQGISVEELVAELNAKKIPGSECYMTPFRLQNPEHTKNS